MITVGTRGSANNGDFMVLMTGSLAAFSSSTTYALTLLHEPTSSQITNQGFAG